MTVSLDVNGKRVDSPAAPDTPCCTCCATTPA
jgi:hypothetical protein